MSNQYELLNSSSKGEGKARGQGNDVHNTLLFTQINSLLKKGAAGVLEITDLPSLPSSLSSFASLNNLFGSKSKANEFAHEEEEDWLKANKSGRSQEGDRGLCTFLRMLLRTHGFTLVFIMGTLKLAQIGASFAGPVILGLLVDHLNSSSAKQDFTQGLLLVLALAASFIFSAVINTQFSLRSNLLQIKIKGALTRACFLRALQLPQFALEQIGLVDGKLITIIQVDVDRVAGTVSSIHDLWALPFQIVVTFVLLYQQVQLAFLAGVILILLMIPINSLIAAQIGRATSGQMVCKDARVRVLSEALRNMCSLKMLNLEGAVRLLSQEARAKEMHYLSRRKYLDAVCVFLWATLPVLVPFVTFASSVLFGGVIGEAQVFTTLALLSMLIFPMNAFPWVVNGFIEAFVSARRIASLLSSRDGRTLLLDLTNKQQHQQQHQQQQQSIKEKEKKTKSSVLLTLTGATWAFAAPAEDDDGNTPREKPCGSSCFCCCPAGLHKKPSISDTLVNSSSLEEGLSAAANTNPLLAAGDESTTTSAPLFSFAVGPITTDFQRGQLICIVGGVASGKSTSLLGLLGEVRLVSGAVRHESLMSYCPQTPIIHVGSIRENILMNSKMDLERYNTVLEGCRLLHDLERGSWPNRDLTVLGQGGAGLSGGQKLRIGVARAMYCKSEIVVLDDCFAALDKSTSKLLRDWLLCEVENNGRLVIVATHSLDLFRDSKNVNFVALQRGSSGIADLGTYATLESESSAFRELTKQIASSLSKSTSTAGTATHNNASSSFSDIDVDQENEEFVHEQAEKNEMERMVEGRISFEVYLSYIRSSGFVSCAFVLLFTLLMQCSSDGMSLYLAYWCSEQQQDVEHRDPLVSGDTFLTIAGSLVAINMFFALVRSFLFAFAGLQAADRIYTALTSSVLGTSITFFEENSAGRIANRFGKDTNTIDDQLPFMINIVLAQVFVLLGIFAVISYTNPFILVVLFGIAFVYYFLQSYYRKSSRGLRRLDAVHRSPLYSIVGDVLSNAPTVRSLNSIDYFHTSLGDALDATLRVSLASTIASQWLSLRLQLLGAIIASALALFALLGTRYQFFAMSPSLLGLSLVYSLSIVSKLNGLIGSLTETEQEMVSFERVSEYVNLPSEKKSRDEEEKGQGGGGTTSVISNMSWPEHGEIVFTGVSMRYRAELPLALKNVSFDIPRGSRVAVVGRSGSGKSSLLRILLRLNDYEGSVHVGGVEISTLSRLVVRERIGVIPQDPLLFSGPLRLSLDPSKTKRDEELLTALAASGFLDTFSSPTSSSPLDHELVEAGKNLSLGQRQLLCLARALLRRSKILLLDEATASLDAACTHILYENIKKTNSEITIFIITHSPSVLKDAGVCDLLLTMRDGCFEKLESF